MPSKVEVELFNLILQGASSGAPPTLGRLVELSERSRTGVVRALEHLLEREMIALPYPAGPYMPTKLASGQPVSFQVVVGGLPDGPDVTETRRRLLAYVAGSATTTHPPSSTL